MTVIVVIRHLYLSDNDGRKRISQQMGHVGEQWPEWGQSLSVYGLSLLCHVLWRTAGTAIGRMEELFIPAILECGECPTSFCLCHPSPLSLCLLTYAHHWGMQDEIAPAPEKGHNPLRQTVIFRPFHRDFLTSRVYS